MTRSLPSGNALVALAFGFALLLSGSRVFAQANSTESLEQTYGRLCGSGQQSDTCAALRQGLEAKLRGASQAQTPPSPQLASTTGSRAGLDLDLTRDRSLPTSPQNPPTGRRSYSDAGYRFDVLFTPAFTVATAGTHGLSEVRLEVTFTVAAKGTDGAPKAGIQFGTHRGGYQSYNFEMTEEGRISFYLLGLGWSRDIVPLTAHSAVRRGTGQSNTLAVEIQGRSVTLFVNGQHAGAAELSTPPHPDVGIFASGRAGDAVVFSSIRAIPLARGQQTAALTAPAASGSANGLGRDAGESEAIAFLNTLDRKVWDTGPSGTYVITRWQVPGRVMHIYHLNVTDLTPGVYTKDWIERGDFSKWRAHARLEVDSSTHTITYVEPSRIWATRATEVRFKGAFQSDGQLLLKAESAIGGVGEIRWRMPTSEDWEWRYSEVDKKVRRAAPEFFAEPQVYSSIDIDQETAHRDQMRTERRRLAEADRLRKEQERAANAGRGGGLMRTIIGAGLGVAAANAGGMDAAQTVGAAAKGVALMNPESQAAQVIGASGDAILQNSGLGTAAAGSSGGSGQASFPKKPNLAVGDWCPGFTMENYRTRALVKDANVQLNTMCGQAFEYYNMYENAIRQGYSEADCNRTYAAHEGAVRNLKAFVAGSQ